MSDPSIKTTRVTLSADGIAQIDNIAGYWGTTRRELLEALMNFVISQDKRPGSWEAQGFDFRNYRDGGFADQWFEPVKPRKP